MHMLLAWEVRVCHGLNQLSRSPALRDLLAVASRLGDGLFWFLLTLATAAGFGRQGSLMALRMLLCAGVGVLVYKAVKLSTARLRPCECLGHLACPVRPLDRYSFPSGHTLHAVCFTTLACQVSPWLGAVAVPFACAVALSRVALGLHYPTDVLAGAALGGALASVVLALG